jgi:hypothetical protein
MIAMLLQIVRIIESTPNDQELGEKIRNLFNNIKRKRNENK